MVSVELEIGKMELIREIMGINNYITLNDLRRYTFDLLHKDKPSTKSDTLTRRMLDKYSGCWEDNRSSDEIIGDIYNARRSRSINDTNPFDA